jgi:hypothetical protein
MAASIPASAIVNVFPNVVAAGGSALDLSGLILTDNVRVPIGSVKGFASANAVAAFFGAQSNEATLATIYFGGYDGSTLKPAELLFAQYPTAPVAPYARGAALTITLDEIKALGVSTLDIDLNGDTLTSGPITLTTAASLSSVAAIITTAFAHFDGVGTGSIAGTVLTLTGSPTGNFAPGQVLSGTNVVAGTKIVSLGTGTGGAGTYNVDTSQTVASTVISAGPLVVTYDTVSGGFKVAGGTPGAVGTIDFPVGAIATALSLTAATGAQLSQGADVATPGEAMAAIVAFTQNFASFMTSFRPSVDDMVAFATWASSTDNRYLYVMHDNNIVATTDTPAASAGARIIAASLSGTMPIYDPTNGPSIAAFVMGMIASIDFSRVEGRTNLALRTQAGLSPGVTNEGIASQLIANGYNFFGRYATAKAPFVFFYPGSVTGPFAWGDSFVDEIWITNNFQLSLMNLLTTVRSIPYNQAGYALIEEQLSGPIEDALSFGAIRAGVTLSAEQILAVNTQAGKPIDVILAQRGWYLQVSPATPQVRAARGSPPVTFWYTDGGSIQKISLNSIEVQ